MREDNRSGSGVGRQGARLSGGEVQVLGGQYGVVIAER